MIQPQWTPDGARPLFTRSRERSRRLEPGDVSGYYQGADLWAIDVTSSKETRLVENAANPCPSPVKSRTCRGQVFAICET